MCCKIIFLLFLFFFFQFLGAIRVWTQKESALSLSQSRFSLEYFSFWVIPMCLVLKIREEAEVDSYLPSSVGCWPSLWRLGIITNKQLLLEYVTWSDEVFLCTNILCFSWVDNLMKNYINWDWFVDNLVMSKNLFFLSKNLINSINTSEL